MKYVLCILKFFLESQCLILQSYYRVTISQKRKKKKKKPHFTC